MFNVEFYETENGQCPVKDFIDSLPTLIGAKTVRDIEILQDKGNTLREPYSKHLKDGVFELRIQKGNDIARVLYFFFVDKKIILTNGFIKKTLKTPPAQIEKALMYKEDYERRCKK